MTPTTPAPRTSDAHRQRRARAAARRRASPRSPPAGCSCRRGCGRRRRCRRARPAASTSPPRSAGDRIRGLLAAVRVRPVVGGHRGRRVRRVLQRIVGAVERALLDRADLVADRDHRVDEAVELGLRLALGRLDHQRAGDREAHRRRVEAVVDQPLRDVVDRDVGRLLERPQVEDALVRDEPARARVQHRIVRRRGASRCSWRRGSRSRSRRAGPSPPIIVMYIHEIGRIDALPYGAARHRADRVGVAARQVAVPGQERREMRADADRPDAGPAAAVRNAERLVQVEVRDVGAELARAPRGRPAH